MLDLGETQAIDRVAVFSVSAVFQGETIVGYGFPRRFRIEVARDVGFQQAELLIDSAARVLTLFARLAQTKKTPAEDWAV